MNRTSLIAILLVFVFVGSSNAQSQQDTERRKRPTYAQLLKEMDINKDGKLAKSELKGPIKDDFAKIDTDNDGFISEKELKEAPKPKRRPKG